MVIKNFGKNVDEEYITEFNIFIGVLSFKNTLLVLNYVWSALEYISRGDLRRHAQASLECRLLNC